MTATHHNQETGLDLIIKPNPVFDPQMTTILPVS